MTYLKENFIISKDDLYINFDEFVNGKSDICLITGLSGSGKSTLGRQLSKKYKAEYVELDKLFIFDNLKDLDEEIRKRMCKPFKNFYKDNEKLYKDIMYKADEDGKIVNSLIMAIIDYCKKFKNKRFVIEGVQIFLYGDKKLKKYPLIFRNTSTLTSMIRMINRDRDYMMEPDRDNVNSKKSYKTLIARIPKFLGYYISDSKDFKKFKNIILKNESYEFKERSLRKMDNFILQEGINEGFQKLLDWFKERIKKIQNKLQILTNKFKRIEKTQDIPQEKKNIFKKAMNAGKDAISSCKKGISACRARKTEMAKVYKEEVSTKMKIFIAIASSFAAGKVKDAVKKKTMDSKLGDMAEKKGHDIGVEIGYGKKIHTVKEDVDLAVLIEADKSITESIKKSLNKLATWFKEKIKNIKTKLASLTKKAEKSEAPDKKSMMQKIRGSVNKIVNSCRKGISFCNRGDAQGASTQKQEVTKETAILNEFIVSMRKAVVGGVVAGVAGRAIAGGVKGTAQGKFYSKLNKN